MADDYLIEPSGNEPDTGKTLSALRKSRDGHGAMLSLFGGHDLLPSSIMRQKRIQADEKLDEHAAERSYIESLPEYNKRGIENTLDGGVKGMHRMNSGSLTGALSKFPQGIGRTVVLFYTDQGDTVVDPFAGHNSRMEMCVRAGRNYIGCDLSQDFMKFNWERAEELKEEYPNRKIKLHNCDSRKQPIADSVGDFTITSPPYWDIEWYGDEERQLGKSETYRDFMDGMREVMAENYRTLKPGAFSAWFINDFRRHGVMYFYHMDIREIGEQVGFIPHDIMIIDLGRGLRDGFVNENVRCKVLPKRHEYCVVLKKPDGTEKKTVAKSAYSSHRSK
jgi:hypothetical protein